MIQYLIIHKQWEQMKDSCFEMEPDIVHDYVFADYDCG